MKKNNKTTTAVSVEVDEEQVSPRIIGMVVF